MAGRPALISSGQREHEPVIPGPGVPLCVLRVSSSRDVLFGVAGQRACSNRKDILTCIAGCACDGGGEPGVVAQDGCTPPEPLSRR